VCPPNSVVGRMRALRGAMLAAAAMVAHGNEISTILHPPPKLSTFSSSQPVRSRQHRRGLSLQAQTDCALGMKISGATLGQLNGVYLRDDAKQVNGRETYWLSTENKFVYYCSKDGTWKINWKEWYGDSSKIGPNNCFYTGYVDASFPTMAAINGYQWFAWTNATGVVSQPQATASCLESCSTVDGTMISTTYPCVCGDDTCHSSQTCTAASSSCSECNVITINGMDAASPTGWDDNVDGDYYRDDCKTIDGRETYWKQGDDYYMYYCAEHASWGISAQHYTSWTAQGNGSCMVKVDGGDDTRNPVAITQWWSWADSRWHRLEGEWSSIMTCPLTSHVPACSGQTPAPPDAMTTPDTTPDTESPVVDVPDVPDIEYSLSPTRVGECPAPDHLASVQYSAGAVVGQRITSGSSFWLPEEDVSLYWPNNFLNCGSWYKLGKNRRVLKGSTVDIACRAEVCDVYVFIYHNPPRSSNSNGKLTSSLPDDGWTPGSCAAQFKFTSDNHMCKHPMVAHRKQLARNSTTTVQIDDEMDAYYMVIAVVSGSDCSYNPRALDKATCESLNQGATASTCYWDETASACEEGWCTAGATSGNTGGGGGAAGGTGAAGGGGSGITPTTPGSPGGGDSNTPPSSPHGHLVNCVYPPLGEGAPPPPVTDHHA